MSEMRRWAFIHALLAILLPVALVLLMGCRKAKEEKGDYGPTVSEDQINKVINDAVGTVSLTELRKDQLLHYELNRRIVGQPTTILMGSHQLEVIDRTDRHDLGATLITIKHDERIRYEKGFKKVVSEDTLPLPLEESTESQFNVSDNNVSAMAVVRAKASATDRTYHNLEVSRGTVEPPADGASRPNCGGLSPCSLPVTYVSYDEIRWYGENDHDTFHFSFIFTNRLPYMAQAFGVMLSGCVAQHVPIGEFRYYVRDCQYLIDYKK
jgi:hypothetical protein